MSLRDDIRLGVEAQSLLDNEVFCAAVERIESRCVAQWRGTFPDDVEEREAAYHLLQALDQLRTELRIILDNGAIAAQALERQQEK